MHFFTWIVFVQKNNKKGFYWRRKKRGLCSFLFGKNEANLVFSRKNEANQYLCIVHSVKDGPHGLRKP
jgi:hypothetical protein